MKLYKIGRYISMNDPNYVRAVVHTDYEQLKSAGEQVKDLEYGIHKLLEYFPKHIFTEESIKENLKKYNLSTMFAVIRRYFAQEYQFSDEKLELNNRYQRSINSYFVHGEKDSDGNLIHIDELYEASVLPFLLASFKWAKEFDNPETYGFGFIHVLYTLNDVSILGNLPDARSSEALLTALDGDLQIINLAEDCYWTITAFNIAHEIAHAYLGYGRNWSASKQTEKEMRQEEYDADAIAYDIILKMIMDSSGRDRENKILEEYTYMAPVIFMDYIDLIYYTDYVLYGACVEQGTHPPVKNRKNKLFSIPDDPKYEFDTVEGNAVYNGFLTVFDEYKTQLYLKKQRGKLNKIINPDRLKRVEEQKREQKRRRDVGSKS